MDYYKVIEIVNLFKLNIDKSNLFDELSTLNQVIKSFNFNDKNQSHDMIWCNILKNDKFPLMLKIIESALCIPISNASVERVFSIMKNILGDERNSLNNNTIKAEVCVKVNYSMNCSQFANFIKNEPQLLSAARSSKKYNSNLY